MGAASSVDMLLPPHIHISFPVKGNNYGNLIRNIKVRLETIGFIVTITDSTLERETMYDILDKAHAIIMCSCETSVSCITQILEYNYLYDKHKKMYNVIIDPYDHIFTDSIKGFFKNDYISVKNIDDIGAIIDEINKNHTIPV